MLKRRFMHSLVAATVLVSMVLQGTWVLAGTTGGLGGSVTQTDSGAPIAGAKVTVTSPSQTATTTTDAGGHFTFVSLAPDTYTLSVEKTGFEPAALSGISVLADQHPSISITTRPTLQTIGRVTARSAAALVKPGTTADVYSVSAAQQTAVQGLGGGGSINQAYSAIASVPGVFVPQGQNGIYQSVYVRGGNYTELGYEFDGVPIQRAFDQYPSTFISSLGQQELQVYTGAAPADAQSTGLAGFINQVIKTGTYPGFANLDLSLGTPSFYHKAMFEVGGATTNRNFSYYIGLAGYNQQFRFGSQYNGAQYDSTFGTPYNLIANNCGTRKATAGCGFLGAGYANTAGILGTPLAPNGYALGPFVYDFNGENDDREAVVNLHIGIPHKNGTKDDIQLLYNNSWVYSPFQTTQSDWGPNAGNVLSGTAQYTSATVPNAGPNVPNCFSTSFATYPCAFLPGMAQSNLAGNFEPFAYIDTTNYHGPMGVKLTQNNLTQVNNYYFPSSSPARAPFAQVPNGQRDTYNNSSSVMKVQYQKNFGSNAFARIYGYTFYSDWLQNGQDSLTQNFTGAVSPNYELITHTRGVVGSFVDQLNSQNLLNFSAGYIFANTVRWNNAFYAAPTRVAVAVNASNPLSGLCYRPSTDSSGNLITGAMTPVYCGSRTVAAYSLPGPALSGLSLAPNYPAIPSSSSTPAFPGVSLNTLNQFSCGGGPCEFYTAENGQRGAYNTVAPAFSNFELSDNWKPNERWNVYGGIRWDDYIYHLTDTSVPAGPEPQAVSRNPRILWQNSYNLFHCLQNGAVITVSTPTNQGGCPSGATPTNVSVNSPGSNSYNVWQPRLGVTYTFDPRDVVRGSWGEYAQPSSSAFQQYNNAQYNLPNVSPNTSFYPLGYFDPSHQVVPEISYNLDLSWEHQQKNTDISWKLTPFLRKTRDELYTVLLDPKTGFVSAINVGNLTASGLEFLIQKGDFSRNGLAAQLAYTYTYATVKFNALPTGGTVLDGVNQSILQYNAYTSFCANHPHGGLCSQNGQPVLPTNGVAAAPCYGPGSTSSSLNVPVSCNTKGAIANPYWTATPQGLYDTGASYIAYNQLPGTGLAAVSSSYNIPHLATLLLNYKHDRLSITPAVQIFAGGRYGSPVQGLGVDPASCAGVLPGAAALDPRYQNGAVGGHPYDASTCTGSIVAPNFQSGHFDNFGAFVEPTSLTMSLQSAYQVSNKLTLRLTAANLYNTCFGGTKMPWTSVAYQPQAGCWFGTPAAYIGNFYNPGDNVQALVKNSYGPQFGNVFQSIYGAQANPFQLFITAEMKI
jgi:Carboxypeptidase regulatory-like domain/TonB dependent receptor/TonB-dependent Receptor Plug Domain